MSDESPKDQNETANTAPALQVVRDEEFTSLYASNVQFESTLWDLKLLFGEVDIAQSRITQHTSIALSWPQAKIAAYFMIVNVIFNQNNIGPVVIPPNLVPPAPDPNDPNLDANSKKLAAYLSWVHKQFFGDPYIPPEVKALG